MSEKKDFDAIVVGSGPNGLAAAITIQQQGLSVLLLEAKQLIGGGMRTTELTLPGFYHDVCSAIHPMAVASPFFSRLPLEKFGLEYIYPPIAVSHPFDGGEAVALYRSVEETAKNLGADEDTYNRLFNKLTNDWPLIKKDLLAPLHFPTHPLAFARFGLQALQPASIFVKKFSSIKARGLFAGLAAHSIQPLTNFTSSAIALVLGIVGHNNGWPYPAGGSQTLANALANYFTSIGGKIETNVYVKNLDQLPSAKAVLLDVSPKQLLTIAGHRFSSIYKWQLERYRYGMGVFKIDFALDGPIPFTNELCRKSGTVHLGNTFEEIKTSEAITALGKHPDKPFVLLAQQSLFDPSRAPKGKHTAWAYCHVPNGSEKDMTNPIENQIERFAPGFKERILAKHVFNTAAMELYNPNYIGGDISGGIADIRQLFTRPALRYSPYRSSTRGIYLCSASTPPGGGVHGMCGYHAALRLLKDIFQITIEM